MEQKEDIEVKMLMLIIICAIALYSCDSNDNPNTIVIVPVEPKLPKIDCKKYLERVAANVAARGLGGSGAGAQLLHEAELDCLEKNRQRGY